MLSLYRFCYNLDKSLRVEAYRFFESELKETFETVVARVAERLPAGGDREPDGSAAGSIAAMEYGRIFGLGDG